MGGPNLKDFISQNFFLAARSEHSGSTNSHPLIVLNAIKNIIGDNKKKPSKILLNKIEKTTFDKPLRLEDKTILKQMAADGLGQSIFIMDLEDACQAGDAKLMEQEAARIHWASENGSAALDSLMEIALQDFDKNGTLLFHLQRASVFNQKNLESWIYTRALLLEMIKESLPEPHPGKNLDQWSYLPKILNTPDLNLWIKYSAALRLWQGDYTRTRGFQREISYWLDSLSFNENSYNSMEKLSGLKSYADKGGSFFIKLAESFIENNTEEKINALEALRFLTNNCSRQNLPLISRAINFIMEL